MQSLRLPLNSRSVVAFACLVIATTAGAGTSTVAAAEAASPVASPQIVVAGAAMTQTPHPAPKAMPTRAQVKTTPEINKSKLKTNGFYLGLGASTWQESTAMTVAGLNIPLHSTAYAFSGVARWELRKASFPLFVDLIGSYGQTHIHDNSTSLQFSQSHLGTMETSVISGWYFYRKARASVAVGPFVFVRQLSFPLPSSDSTYNRNLLAAYGGSLSVSWRVFDQFWFYQSLSFAVKDLEPIWRAGLLWTLQ
jgi:hypothetical protein